MSVRTGNAQPASEAALATRFRAADESPGLLLWQVTNRWQAAQRAALKPFGLTHVQFVLLASLAWLNSDGPITQRELADHAATDPMMTSQVLRTLAQRCLVDRSPHPLDGRAQALTLTRRGPRARCGCSGTVRAAPTGAHRPSTRDVFRVPART